MSKEIKFEERVLPNGMIQWRRIHEVECECIRRLQRLRMTDLRKRKMINIKLCSYYRGTVKLRKFSPKGEPLKPEAEALEGKRLTFQAMWMIEDDERYPGEWAMRICDPTISSISWIASGDIVDLKQATMEEIEQNSIERHNKIRDHKCAAKERIVNPDSWQIMDAPTGAMLSVHNYETYRTKLEDTMWGFRKLEDGRWVCGQLTDEPIDEAFIFAFASTPGAFLELQ